LDYNKISHLPIEILSQFPRLNEIYIHGNNLSDQNIIQIKQYCEANHITKVV